MIKMVDGKHFQKHFQHISLNPEHEAETLKSIFRLAFYYVRFSFPLQAIKIFQDDFGIVQDAFGIKF